MQTHITYIRGVVGNKWQGGKGQVFVEIIDYFPCHLATWAVFLATSCPFGHENALVQVTIT